MKRVLAIEPIGGTPQAVPGATACEPVADGPLCCWTRGGADWVYQCCGACKHRWYFQRDFCPRCGSTVPTTLRLGGHGIVHASTLVHRAPSDEFRAIAPYRVVLVEADEGVRLMAHGDRDLAIGDRVQGSLRHIAGRLLPYVEKQAA